MRPLSRQKQRVFGLVCSNSHMKAEFLAVFCSVKPNTGGEGCDRTLIPRTGRSDASRQKAKQTVAILQAARQKQCCSFLFPPLTDNNNTTR